MALYELECGACGRRFEVITKDKDSAIDEPCPHCGAQEAQHCFTGFGGYSIKGNNSASVRPKGAGSRKP